MSQPLAARLGIMQGRLVASNTGELECSPGPRWRDEFSIAATLALNHIELVADRFPDAANPIWSVEGRSEIMAVAATTGVRHPSLCVNETLASPFEHAQLALELGTRLERVVSELNVRTVVLPLLEASDPNVLEWADAAASVRVLADRLRGHGARLVLELGLSAGASLLFLEAVGSRHVGLCYDVGNATALGFDAPAELRILGRRVWHVHVKDKNAAGQNVRFGVGNVPFGPVLAALAEENFDGLVTMEATRGDDPIHTASEHRSFLLSMESYGRELR